MRPLLFFAAFGLAVACSPSARVCEDYVPPASFDPQNPVVSFSNDVAPIFKQSCSFTSCHGASDNDHGVYLNVSAGNTRIHDGLVGQPAQELTSMSYVTAGDPRKSYLMLKVDGAACTLDAQCTNGSCGAQMPRADAPLPLASRDVIRRWIAQGAKND